MYETKEGMVVFGIIKAMTYILKFCLVWFGTMAIAQQINDNLFNMLMEGMPSRVAFWLGFLYLIFIVIRKGHDTYTHIKLNQMKIKKKRDKLK